MYTTRASKRPRLDTNVRGILRDIPDTLSPVAVLRLLTKEFGVDPAMVEEDEPEDETGGSSSINVTYKQAAPLVGLVPSKKLKDIGTFEIHRSRIPTELFKSIVTDMDTMLIQHGAQARSRFYSPVLNHLMKQFNVMLRNEPEVVVDDDGRIGTQGLIQSLFKTFGAVTMLFVEKKLKVENEVERLKAIAQVIAEIDNCDLDNKSHGHNLPIHCVFSHGLSFEFFKFERKPNPSFTRGCFPGDPKCFRRGLHLPNLTATESRLPFILKLRSVCETIFDMILSAYIEGLKANHKRLVQDEGKYEDSKWSSLDGWDQGLQSAECAFAAFRRAEDQRKGGDIKSADQTVDQALLALQESTGAVPTVYKCGLFEKSWDETEVRKA